VESQNGNFEFQLHLKEIPKTLPLYFVNECDSIGWIRKNQNQKEIRKFGRSLDKIPRVPAMKAPIEITIKIQDRDKCVLRSRRLRCRILGFQINILLHRLVSIVRICLCSDVFCEELGFFKSGLHWERRTARILLTVPKSKFTQPP
jgi:hypothetical protein